MKDGVGTRRPRIGRSKRRKSRHAGEATESLHETKKAPMASHGGFLKSGDTYFRVGIHYHRLAKLNYCVRDGNRCDLCDIVTGRSLRGVETRSGQVGW